MTDRIELLATREAVYSRPMPPGILTCVTLKLGGPARLRSASSTLQVWNAPIITTGPKFASVSIKTQSPYGEPTCYTATEQRSVAFCFFSLILAMRLHRQVLKFSGRLTAVRLYERKNALLVWRDPTRSRRYLMPVYGHKHVLVSLVL